MRYTANLLLGVLLGLNTLAQDPFTTLDRPSVVLTLTGQTYPETFQNDSIVKIGSILFDTRSRCVVAVIERDTGYSFGFTSMEKDDEIHGATGTSYDFGARLLDVRVGGWLSLDPLAAKYPDITPYAGLANNPVLFLDPDGKDVYVFIQRTSATDPGHTMIGVTEYNEVGEKTGRILVYSMHPNGPWPVDGNPVRGRIDMTAYSATDFATQFGPRSEFQMVGEGEYLQIGTSKATDLAVAKSLSDKMAQVNAGNKLYQVEQFNCTSLASETLETFVYPGEQPGTTTVEVDIPGPVNIKSTIDSPNHLWNDVKDKKNVVFKSTDQKMDEGAAQDFVNEQTR